MDTIDNNYNIEVINTLTDKQNNRENVNEYNNNGYTKFCIEVAMGKRKNVDRLLHLGADPNLASADSYSPLHIACKNGNLKIIRSLLKYGANTEQECNEGDTALMIAISSGNYMTCKLLLDNGANPNYINYYGIVPLLRAAICERPDILRLLLDKGANCNHFIKTDKRAYTVLESLKNCFFKDNSSTMKILISEIIISNCRDNIDIEGFHRNIAIIARDQYMRNIALKCKTEINFMCTRGIGDKSLFRLCVMKEYNDINKNLLVNYLDRLIETRDLMTMYCDSFTDIINVAIRRKELIIMAMNVKSYTLNGNYINWINMSVENRIQILQHLSDDMLMKVILNDVFTLHKIEKQ
ncbi:ankyrin repeat protein [Fowlpox virus]|nr:ankyrin repeat protein [Fowlpox virus]